MSYVLQHDMDFDKHNEEVSRVWEAYWAGEPRRVPVTVSGSIRNLFGNPEINTTGYTFADFFCDPEAQIRCQLVYADYVRHNIVCDLPMGIPEEGWQVNIDFQNSYEAGWFGCPLHVSGNAVPDTTEILKEHKERLYDLAPPDPLRGGLLGRALEFFEVMWEKCPRLEYRGKPVLPPRFLPGEGTDGPFNLAYKVRGATEVCLDMYEDPEYYHDLMGFVTEAIIERMKALRRWRWERFPDSPDRGCFRRPGWGFADDAVAMLSCRDYERFVLPYHRRLVEEFSDGGRISIHLCGDATHLFPLLKERLNVWSFDTGFPVDHGALRRALGPEVEIRGGPTVMLLQSGTPAQIQDEVRRICGSGIMEGGRFILREANNLAPRTPVENILAMYEAGKRFGIVARG